MHLDLRSQAKLAKIVLAPVQSVIGVLDSMTDVTVVPLKSQRTPCQTIPFATIAEYVFPIKIKRAPIGGSWRGTPPMCAPTYESTLSYFDKLFFFPRKVTRQILAPPPEGLALPHA